MMCFVVGCANIFFVGTSTAIAALTDNSVERGFNTFSAILNLVAASMLFRSFLGVW